VEPETEIPPTQAARLKDVSAELHALPDESLMTLLKLGRHEAMTPLFRRYRRLLLAISRYILHDHSEAEEVIQEVFFEIYRKIERFDPNRGTAKAWFIQCAYARSMDRREFLNYRQFCDHRQIPRVLPDRSAPPYHSDGLDENAYERQRQIVRLALERLPEKQKKAVELACFEGLLLREIAVRIADSYENTRNHYYRGLRKLQELVNEMRLLDTDRENDGAKKAAG